MRNHKNKIISIRYDVKLSLYAEDYRIISVAIIILFHQFVASHSMSIMLCKRYRKALLISGCCLRCYFSNVSIQPFSLCSPSPRPLIIPQETERKGAGGGEATAAIRTIAATVAIPTTHFPLAISHCALSHPIVPAPWQTLANPYLFLLLSIPDHRRAPPTAPDRHRPPPTAPDRRSPRSAAGENEQASEVLIPLAVAAPLLYSPAPQSGTTHVRGCGPLIYRSFAQSQEVSSIIIELCE